MTSAPPGWYPDATQHGQERWWDGGAWSDVTRPAPGGPAARQAPDQAAGQTGAYAVGSTRQDDPFAPPGEPAQQGQQPYGQTQGQPYGQYGQTQQYGQPYGQTQQYGQPYGQYPGTGPYPGGPVPGGRPTPDGVPTAGPWRRLGGALLDGLIVGVITALVGAPLVSSVVDDFRRYVDDAVAAANAGAGSPDASTFIANVTPDLLRLGLLQLLVWAVYEIPLIKYRGQTVGKMAARTRVRPLAQEGLPTWGTSVLRWFGSRVLAAIPNIGSFYSLLDSLWLLWDPRRQCLHDKIARTAVVRKQ